jgi:hypothetical protein
VKAKGGLITTPNCLGFRSAGIQTQKAIAIPKEIEVVNRIFQMFDRGMNVNQIVTALMDEGFTIPEDLQAKMSRGRTAWHKETIYYSPIKRMLQDCRYQGRQKFQGKEWDCPTFLIDGKPAVPTELYERVQQKIKNQQHIPYRARYRHPLSGLVKCGLCGEGLQRKIGSRGKRIFYWMPKNHGKNHVLCKHGVPTVMMDQVDEYIATILIPDIIRELEERGQVVDEAAIRARIAELEAQLIEEKKKSSDLMSYFGKISAEAFIELESTFTKSIEDMREEIKKLELKLKAVDNIGEKLARWDALSDGDKRDIFRSLIRWVVVLPPLDQKMVPSKSHKGKMVRDPSNWGRYVTRTTYGTFHTGIVYRTGNVGHSFEVKLRRAEEGERFMLIDDLPNKEAFDEGIRRFAAAVSYDPIFADLELHFMEEED